MENIDDHEEDFENEEDFDHFDDHTLPNFNTVVGNILLELRKHFNVTTKATGFIAEKMSQIIDSDRKLFSSVLSSALHKIETFRINRKWSIGFSLDPLTSLYVNTFVKLLHNYYILYIYYVYILYIYILYI